MNQTKSPCINKCMTTTSGDYCNSCGRTAEEVINWNQYSDNNKQHINQRILYERFNEGRVDVSKINRGE